jgi:hypothetical protein
MNYRINDGRFHAFFRSENNTKNPMIVFDQYDESEEFTWGYNEKCVHCRMGHRHSQTEHKTESK